MKSKKVLEASFWYMFSSFLLKGLSFITVPIFTRLMTETEVGQFSVLTTWISLLAPIVTVSFYESVILAKYDFKEEHDQFISSISILGFIITFAVYVIACIRMDLTVKIIKMPSYAVHVMFWYLLSLPGIELLQAKFRANLKYKPVVFLSVFSSLVSVGLALLLVLKLGDHFKARTIGTYIPLIILYFILLSSLVLKGKSFSWKYNKYALSICVPLVIHGLAGNIMHSSDRIMIQQLCDDKSVALYSVAYSCGMIINIIRNSVQSAWDPWLFEKLNEDKKSKIRKFAYPYVLLFAGMSLGIIMLAPEIMIILGGEKYKMACYVIPPVVISYFVSMIYSLYSGLERYYKQQKWFAIFAFISAGCNVILNFLFIPKYGYIAAAYTTLASSIIECALHFFNAKRLGYTDTYDNRFNLLMIIACMAMSILITTAYGNYIIRYIVIGVVLVVFIVFIKIKKDLILKFLKEFKK